MPAPEVTDHDPLRGGLAWTHELDLAQILAAIGATQLGEAGDEDAGAEEAAAMEAAAEAGTPARDLTGVIADQLPPGPALAACLSGADPAALSEWDLPGVAAAFRRLAAWAQAGELAAVAEIASRTAARDDHVRVGPDGRPDQVTPAAGSEVGLELVMSHPAAMAWTGLGVTLRWRLAATWAALSAGTIDLYRARLIAEATSPLDDDTAREVESAVLPKAGGQTSGQLRVALRRAVIAADPEGAEQRRQDAQRHAKVSLYPDPEGTATLAATRLPGVHAAAGMARLTAIARAMKSAGMAGGLDYLRAVALIGLLLGTLPLVPPPAGDPGPEGPTDPDPGPPDSDPSDPGPGEPTGPGPDPGGPGPGGPGPRPGPGPGDLDPTAPGSGSRTDPDPGDDDEDAADDHRDPRPDELMPPDPGPPATAPPHDPPDAAYSDDYEDDDPFGADPPAAWPPIPATLTQTPPFLGQPPPGHPPLSRPPPVSHPPPRGQPARPPPSLLDLVISWRALNGDPAGPAALSRIGPITAIQARLLALTAAADQHARWQVILTNQDGHAIAVETIRRHRGGRGRRPAGVTGQVTVTIPAADLPPDTTTDTTTGNDSGTGIRAAVLRAARRAHARARRQAAADAAAPGGCGHTTATAAYRPTTKIRDHVVARDQTCRNPRCRQPARHTDLDHTTAWHKGGPTCECNLGGHCRTHHKIKQLPGWTLTQPKPGHFQLTTPTGRTYTTTPDPYPT